MDKTNRFYYVRRIKDGIIMDIPERHLKDTLKTGKFELVVDEPVERIETREARVGQKLTKDDL